MLSVEGASKTCHGTDLIVIVVIVVVVVIIFVVGRLANTCDQFG